MLKIKENRRQQKECMPDTFNFLIVLFSGIPFCYFIFFMMETTKDACFQIFS
jgi:hypothetical protein